MVSIRVFDNPPSAYSGHSPFPFRRSVQYRIAQSAFARSLEHYATHPLLAVVLSVPREEIVLQIVVQSLLDAGFNLLR